MLCETNLCVLRENIIAYLFRLYDEKTGGFRFASHEPATVMATTYVVLVLEFIGGLSRLNDLQESAIIRFLMTSVKPDGVFHDSLFRQNDFRSNGVDLTYFQAETTTFCQQALDALLAPPPPPRDWSGSWHTLDNLIRYFESLPWKTLRLDSNRVLFVLSQLCHDAERHQKSELLDVVDIILDWLDTYQNPETGFWFKTGKVSSVDEMSAASRLISYYSYRRRRVQHIERIIDSCLALQQHRIFSQRDINSICLVYETLNLLAKASLVTDHRAKKVKALMRQAYKVLRWMESIMDTYLCEANPWNIPALWFFLLSLQLVTQWQWLHEGSNSPVQFRRLPFLGYHDPLAMQSAHGVITTVPLTKNTARQHQRKKSNLRYTPLISVIIPAYNAEKTLSETLGRLRSQTYPHWEAIIVNDGSTDGTSALAHHWARSDSRITVIDQTNTGLGGARNAALKAVQGELVHCLDADDLIEPDFYEYVCRGFSQTQSEDRVPGYCAVCSVQFFTGGGRILSTYWTPPVKVFQFPRLAQRNPFPPVTYIFERSILKLTGIFDEKLKHCQDWDLWLRFARIGVRVIRIPEGVAMFRIAGDSLSRRYDSFVNAATILLKRATKEDTRCVSGQFQQALPLPETVIEQGIVWFWFYNIQRATSRNEKDGLVKLFSWAKNHLPQDFWDNPLAYNVDLSFQWTEAFPKPDREVENEIRYRMLYLDALDRLWPTRLPEEIITKQVRAIISLLTSLRSLLHTKQRLRLILHVISWQQLRKLRFRKCLAILGIELAKKLRFWWTRVMVTHS